MRGLTPKKVVPHMPADSGLLGDGIDTKYFCLFRSMLMCFIE